jgi:hypothetical protein
MGAGQFQVLVIGEIEMDFGGGMNVSFYKYWKLKFEVDFWGKALYYHNFYKPLLIYIAIL